MHTLKNPVVGIRINAAPDAQWKFMVLSIDTALLFCPPTVHFFICLSY